MFHSCQHTKHVFVLSKLFLQGTQNSLDSCVQVFFIRTVMFWGKSASEFAGDKMER